MKPIHKYLSYIYRIELERYSSAFNKKLVVAIQNGKLVLNADHANYSFASLHRVFQQALNAIDLAEKRSVLVLGCGAGSIPHIIYKERGLSTAITAIEIDPVVIEIGNKYFGLGEYEHLDIEIADALEYMKTNEKQYDLICVDLFQGIEVPKQFLSKHFIDSCKRALTGEGELLLNFVVFNHETKTKVKEIEEQLKACFSQVEILRLEGVNRVFRVKQ